MRIDLHTHTTSSDGTLSPEELVEFAASCEVDVIAVTDHDTVAACDPAARSGERHGVEVLCGIEVSSRLDGRNVHVLGIFVDPQHPRLVRANAEMRSERTSRAERMVERLRELGYEVTFEEVAEQASGGVIGRPHVARALVARGYIRDVGEAFTEELISDGGRADVPRHLPSPSEAIALVQGADGAAVLAHPGVPHHAAGKAPLADEEIAALAAEGLDGLEVDHPDHGAAARERLRGVADALGLVPTGGSDCHGHERRPGTCTTSPEALEALRSRARGRRSRADLDDLDDELLLLYDDDLDD